MNHAMPSHAVEQATPVLVIRTGRADCHAHFHPDRYQLVLHQGDSEEKIDLGFSGSRLLERLLRAPGEVVPREELLAHAWSDRVVGQGSLNQQIYTLRQLLGDEKKREIIQTLPRRGYLFNPKCLAPAELPEAPGEPVQPAAPETATRLTALQRRLIVALGCFSAVFGVGLLVYASIHYALFQSQVVVQERQIGQLHITYFSSNGKELAELMNETSALSERFAALGQRATHLHLGKASEYVELLCSRGGHSGHWLMIHERQLERIDDALLRSCLQ